MSIVESIRGFVKECPFLKDGRISVDFLGKEPGEYVIEGSPVSAMIKQYTDGGKLKQYSFVFGSREWYGLDVVEQLENSGFYEQFAKWLDEQTGKGKLPALEENRRAHSIEALSNGYVFDTDGKFARYQIQCRLIYFERGY